MIFFSLFFNTLNSFNNLLSKRKQVVEGLGQTLSKIIFSSTGIFLLKIENLNKKD